MPAGRQYARQSAILQHATLTATPIVHHRATVIRHGCGAVMKLLLAKLMDGKIFSIPLNSGITIRRNGGDHVRMFALCDFEHEA
jgi:hypothetical protein